MIPFKQPWVGAWEYLTRKRLAQLIDTLESELETLEVLVRREYESICTFRGHYREQVE